MVELFRGGSKSPADLAELFSVARSTVYRALQGAEEVHAVAPGSDSH